MVTIPGSKSGTRPYLELDWSVNSQDIANNRSSVKLKLYLQVDYSIGYSARYTGTLQGASFTSSSGYISKPGRYLLTQRDVWIGHNSDGSKTVTLTADYNLNITWGGTYFGKITLSGSANLGTIPRASTISAFSFAANLKPSTAVTIKYTVDRKSTAFRHQVQLRDGSHVVQTWDNQDSNGASTVSLSSTNVNNLLKRMSSVTSRSLTLRVSTRSGSGGGWIGSAVTRNATATVDSTVKPTVSALTISQTGNSVTSHYLQGMSKVTGKFTRTAVGGATIASSSITVRRKTSNTDVQTINSNDGTTGKTVSLTGTYQAQGTAKDSRGRTTTTAWAEFTVTAYSSPRITTFTAVRNASTPTTVNISRAGAHTHLGGSNVLTYTVQRRSGTGSWTNVNTNPTGTSKVATFSGTSTSTGNSVTASYDFRMTITDKFGNKAESVVSVSTQRVVLDIHKNEGVGIGKIHEQGVLDVDGGAYFLGGLFVDGISVDKAQSFTAIHPTIMLDTIQNWQTLPHGYYFVRPGEIQSQPESYGVIEVMKQGSGTSDDYNIIWYTQGSGPIYRKSGNGNTMTGWVKISPESEYGSNSNGEWIKFESGLQICWNRIFTVPYDINTRLTAKWTFPQKFVANATVIGNRNEFHGSGTLVGSSVGTGQGTSNAVIRVFAVNGTVFGSTATADVRLMAIGKWK